MKTLAELRNEIDGLDEQIGRLLEERWLRSQQIQLLKKKEVIPLQDLARETWILKRLVDSHPHLPESLIRKIYQEIFNAAYYYTNSDYIVDQGATMGDAEVCSLQASQGDRPSNDGI